MKQILGSFFRQFLFWILFFSFTRLVFLVYHIDLILVEKIPLAEVLKTFLYSFKLDLATACYFMLFPFLILLVQSLYSPSWLNRINQVYSGILIFFYSLTATGEMGIYAEWKTKLTYKVIKYLSHPSEIYNSAGSGTFFFLLVLLILIFSLGLFAYLKYFYPAPVRVKRNYWFSLGFMVLMPPLLFIGLRGGVQAIPINQSQSYFSKYNILNIASVNNAFNLYISIFENLNNFDRNPYVFMDPVKAKETVRELFTVKKDTTISVLTLKRPNIVFLILESWSGDLIPALGGKPGITPEFNKLEKDGILFTQFYSSGMRSEQGMAAIFSGFPAHPISCVTVQPDKYEHLPSLPKELMKQGYSSAFYFGGQLIYGNIKGYIYFNGFEKILEGKDFPENLPRGKLGIHDEYMLNYLAGDLKNLRKPFLAALFTLSSHSPFDQPYPRPLTWGDNERQYINSALYTDHCLGEFFEKARKQPWYDSTLFILVADHSHNSYYNWSPHQKEYRRIPMLFYGNVIRPEFRGKQWDKLGNHQDIPATLLKQLGMNSSAFTWSRNLFNPHISPFAFYSNEDGPGWIRPDAYISFDQGLNYYYALEAPPQYKDSLVNEAKAYLQVLFTEYLSK